MPPDLSLRDYFAAAVLPALVNAASPSTLLLSQQERIEQAAARAYAYADALLRQRTP